MKKNYSPWIHQLDKERATVRLTRDAETDVAIIGAGIAGIATAFFILKYTNKSVIMLERTKLAHGATGHNAGQVVSYFERGLESLVEEFGLESAIAAQKAIEDTWTLLDEMYTDARLDIPFSRFMGHKGLISVAQVQKQIRQNMLREEGGLKPEKVRIASNLEWAHHNVDVTHGMFELIPHQSVLNTLETDNKEFIAVVSRSQGCINSALFCEEVLKFLTETYKDRFALYEETPMHKVVLKSPGALIDTGNHTLAASQVVLCTNGFENFRIISDGDLEVDTSLHQNVRGVVGFMSAYIEPLTKPPAAFQYYVDPRIDPSLAYVYLTRRPYEYEKGVHHNLISIGGPELELDAETEYIREVPFPDERKEEIDAFLTKVYGDRHKKDLEYKFTWHGLMGYTKNRVRMVGPVPGHAALLYNIGCNGVGILPSIFGGRRIASHLAGDSLEPMIFDVS